MTARKPLSTENPFSVRRQRRRRDFAPLVRAAKYLVAVSVAFAITLVVIDQNQRWLLGSLTDGFDRLSAEEKISRLVQIAEIGPNSIPHLVRTLADRDAAVAQTASHLLRDSQERWPLESRRQHRRNHRLLVDALTRTSSEIAKPRTPWVTNLLQQTIVEAASQSEPEWTSIQRDAAEVIARLSSTPAPEVPGLAGEITRRASAKPYMEPRAPLPLQTGEGFVRWPPEQGRRLLGGNESAETEAVSAPPSRDARDSGPTVYRTTRTLRALPPDDGVVLPRLPASNPNTDSFATATSGRDTTRGDRVLPARHTPTDLIGAPFAALDVKSVIDWLADPDPELRRQAELELRRRGMNHRELSLAASIASGDVATRLQLIDMLAHSQDVDPRFWLGILLTASERRVKLAAISVLATMRDPKVRKLLQVRMNEDPDPVVVAKLRRVLGLG